MVSREAVVAEARAWLGVPLIHRGRDRQGGVDCLGLVIVVGVGSGAVDDPGAALDAFGDYGRLPNAERLAAGLDAFLVRACDTGRPGDVVGLHWGRPGAVMHLAILADYAGRASMIHAYPLIRPKAVVEVSFAGLWPNRVCGFWRFPNVED